MEGDGLGDKAGVGVDAGVGVKTGGGVVGFSVEPCVGANVGVGEDVGKL